MSIELFCEFCGERHRLRDDAAGRTIKCKGCGTKIEVPEGNGDDSFDDYPPPRRFNDGERPRRRRRSSSSGNTLGPAIGLYIMGGMSLLSLIAGMALSAFDPDLDDMRGDKDFMFWYQVIHYTSLLFYAASTLGVLFGAFCMQTRRMYKMAMFGCVLAAIPCCSPCLLLGMPFGIWGIVVLNGDGVKDSFS